MRNIDALDQFVAAPLHAGKQDFSGRLDAAIDVADPRQDVVGGFSAGVGEASGEAVADSGDRHGHLRTPGDDALERRGAGAVDGVGDLLRRCAERGDETLAGFVEAIAEAGAGRIEVFGNAVVRVGDRVAHPRPADHDRLPLIRHLGDQQTDLALIVGIGALEGRDLGPHARLELGRPREGPFDAVAHEGELAADRLRQAHHMLAGHRLRLGQTNRHLGNRARRLTQFAQSARERGKAEHEENRPQRRQRQQRRLGPQQALPERRGGQGRPQIFIAVDRADRRPDD